MLLFFLLTAGIEGGLLDGLANSAFRRDIPGIEQSRQAIAELSISEARKAYLLALTDWFLSQAGRDPKVNLAAAVRGLKEAERAIVLDPESAHAQVIRFALTYQLFSQNALEPKAAIAAMRDAVSRSKSLAPDDPLVALIEGAQIYYSPKPDREGGRRLMRQALTLLGAKKDQHSRLWQPVASLWYSTTFLAEGDMESARKALEDTLALRPDYAVIRSTFLPMTNTVEPGPAPDFTAVGWLSLVDDKAGDPRMPGLPDLRTVEWRRDDSGRTWFRLTLKDEPDPSRLGVNIAIDSDGDPTNGNSWWATKGFHYDRLVTVWVSQGCDGKYRGTVGVAGAVDAAAGRYAAEKNARVRFHVDPAQKAILIGIENRHIAEPERTRLVFTVGTNSMWSDTAPDSGHTAMAAK